MIERDLSLLVGEFYEAGSGGDSDWLSVGEKLCRLLGAGDTSLSVRQAGGNSVNILRPMDSGETLYNAHYRFIDPIRPAAEAIRFNGDWFDAVRFNEELVPSGFFRNSEFYQEFARPFGQEHMMIGALGDRDHTLLVLFRDSSPFDSDDKAAMAQLLPHVRKTLELQRRLASTGAMTVAGLASLEAAETSVIVVDAAMGICFANATAERMASQESSSFAFRGTIKSRERRSRLVARFPAESQRLKTLVADAASGGTGGGVRLGRGGDVGAFQDVAVVSPVPAGLRPLGHSGEKLVLVVVRALKGGVLPTPALFEDIFGLSKAEAAVAVALLGGKSAEEVAVQRNVSLDTIRSQIRSVLSKSDAANLRDFERIGAVLGSMHPGRG